MKKHVKCFLLFSVFFLALGCQISAPVSSGSDDDQRYSDRKTQEPQVEINQANVVVHYADIAYAVYFDALTTAETLKRHVDYLIRYPTEVNLQAARVAWRAARVPYQQSEVFRFGNAIVDDWEGQVNAWPLDEGFIDYVDTSYYEYALGNHGAVANVIANSSIRLGLQEIKTNTISPDLIKQLNEFGGSEANVASGYHAIEFLLWGQDLNGSGVGAGKRLASDYAVGDACTHGHCDRRGEYLSAATALLVSDLRYMVNQWSPDGDYRRVLIQDSALNGIRKMLYGMGSLSLGELAGERMKVALIANSVEDEHDCFSDNTHYSHFYDGKGIQNIYLGEYRRTDDALLKGPSLSDLVSKLDPQLDKSTKDALAQTMRKLQNMVDIAERDKNPMRFDQMIEEGNEQGSRLVNEAIDALANQTVFIEQVAELLKIQEVNPKEASHQ